MIQLLTLCNPNCIKSIPGALVDALEPSKSDICTQVAGAMLTAVQRPSFGASALSSKKVAEHLVALLDVFRASAVPAVKTAMRETLVAINAKTIEHSVAAEFVENVKACLQRSTFLDFLELCKSERADALRRAGEEICKKSSIPIAIFGPASAAASASAHASHASQPSALSSDASASRRARPTTAPLQRAVARPSSAALTPSASRSQLLKPMQGTLIIDGFVFSFKALTLSPRLCTRVIVCTQSCAKKTTTHHQVVSSRPAQSRDQSQTMHDGMSLLHMSVPDLALRAPLHPAKRPPQKGLRRHCRLAPKPHDSGKAIFQLQNVDLQPRPTLTRSSLM